MAYQTKPKTLLIEYAPRGNESRTKRLRTYFTDLIQDHTSIEQINLCTDTPDLFNYERLQAYYKRNYRNEPLTPEETKSLAKMDAYRDQMLRNDILIISSPMYNFGYPAAVKAWIDSVMQRGYAFTTDIDGHVPKLQHLKVLILYTAGITFDQIGENEVWNGLKAEGLHLFEYMGAHVRVVHVEGVDMLKPEYVDYRTEKVAKLKLNTLAKRWYGVQHDLEIYS